MHSLTSHSLILHTLVPVFVTFLFTLYAHANIAFLTYIGGYDKQMLHAEKEPLQTGKN